MSLGVSGSSGVFADAALACALVAVDPVGLGGIVLRGRPGLHRDQICDWLRQLSRAGSPFVRIPLHVTEDRLLGGLSLVDTLRLGRVVLDRGLLASADGGFVVVAMAERLEARVTTSLCAALDRGEVLLERDGIGKVVSCKLGAVLLDEGIEDERAPAPLRDRLAFHVEVDLFDPRAEDTLDLRSLEEARALLPSVRVDAGSVEALCEVASALGISSVRGPLLATSAARAHAALEGRVEIEEADVVAAARLVLGPRATRLPEPTAESSSKDDPGPASDAPADAGDDNAEEDPERASELRAPPADVVLDAAKSAVPPGLLDALAAGRDGGRTPRRAGHAGALRVSPQGGRPAGTRAAVPRAGERVNVVETLRAAAPWQAVRLRALAGGGRRGPSAIELRKEDFRVTRYQHRAETCVIFAVDASGSAALQRLAEAKGAVEQILADCYVRRDHVALVAFRGTNALVLLPPTRSLTRARRCLADLAGGGSTPLCAGIDAGMALAMEARKRGRTPVLVLMTDARANVARGGATGSVAAMADALSSARGVRAAGVGALFLDTAPRPRAQARLLALEMGARYLPLPYVDAAGIARHVRFAAEASS